MAGVELPLYSTNPSPAAGDADNTSMFMSDLGIQGETVTVESVYGPVNVTISGERHKSPLITYHDIGLNYRSCFQGLFLCAEGSSILQNKFCVYHIDAPGHSDGAKCGAPDSALPMTVDKLADQVAAVVKHFGLKDLVCMGVGAGGYILSKYALSNKKIVKGLILISSISQAPGWWEWGNLQAAIMNINKFGITRWVNDFILNRLFSVEGRGIMGTSDLAQAFRREIETRNPQGLAQYLTAMMNRKDIGPDMERAPFTVLQIVGEKSPFHEDSLDLNQYLDSSRSSWIEVPRCGSVITEERPDSLTQSIDLFFKGLQQIGIGL